MRKKLNLVTLRKEKVIIKTFGQNDCRVQNLDVVQFKVRDKRDNSFVFVEALCVPNICSPLTRQDIDLAKHLYKHVSSLDLADSGNCSEICSIDILIGVDFYHSFLTGKFMKANEGPVASESILGWVLSGCIKSNSENCSALQHCFKTHVMRCVVEERESLSQEQKESDKSLQDDLSKFWNVEDVPPSDCVTTRFEKSITFDGERYVARLPFKPNHDLIPDNFKVCENRLSSLKSKLQKQGMLDKYNNVFNDYLENGIIEEVPKDEIVKDTGSVHYVPHRPVAREDKDTTKIRAVFDASCNNNGPSLNQCLYSGPNLLGNIFDILFRFRFNKYVIIADIKQAFLNVRYFS